MFSFIYPVFKKARGGHVFEFIANFMSRAHEFRQTTAISSQFFEHDLGTDGLLAVIE